MCGAGPVEFLHDLVRYFLLITEDHGLDDLPIRSRCGLQYGLPDEVAETLHSCSERITGFPPQDDESRGIVDERPRQDPPYTKILFVIKAARVAKVMGESDSRLEADIVSIVEWDRVLGY